MSKLDQTVPEKGHYLFTGLGQVYLEFIDLLRNSKKWYLIEVLEDRDGFTVRRSWGRIGRYQQDRKNDHASLSGALKQANSKCREKLRKGYRQKERPAEERMQRWLQGSLDF